MNRLVSWQLTAKRKDMDIDKMTDNQIAAYAIRLWMNYIQTGDPCLAVEDAERMGGGKPKRLSVEQMRGVIRLDDVYKRFLAS